MSVDNPFEEDSDRTVIRPAPGGRRPAAPPPAAPGFGASTSFPPATGPAPAAQATTGEGAEKLLFGGSALLSSGVVRSL